MLDFFQILGAHSDILHPVKLMATCLSYTEILKRDINVLVPLLR